MDPTVREAAFQAAGAAAAVFMAAHPDDVMPTAEIEQAVEAVLADLPAEGTRPPQYVVVEYGPFGEADDRAPIQVHGPFEGEPLSGEELRRRWQFTRWTAGVEAVAIEPPGPIDRLRPE